MKEKVIATARAADHEGGAALEKGGGGNSGGDASSAPTASSSSGAGGRAHPPPPTPPDYCERSRNRNLCLPPTYSKFELPFVDDVNVVEIGIDISDVLRIDDKVREAGSWPGSITNASGRKPVRAGT